MEHRAFFDGHIQLGNVIHLMCPGFCIGRFGKRKIEDVIHEVFLIVLTNFRRGYFEGAAIMSVRFIKGVESQMGLFGELPESTGDGCQELRTVIGRGGRPEHAWFWCGYPVKGGSGYFQGEGYFHLYDGILEAIGAANPNAVQS